jgi:hypothetical protein
MELRYKFTEEDALHASRVTSRQPWALFLFVLLLALMFVVGIFLVAHDLATIGWIWLAMSAALGFAVYEVPRIQIRRALRRNPSLHGEVVLALHDQGIESTFATGKSQLLWGAFTKCKETTYFFVLYMSPHRASFIPKRVMTPQQIEELRALLRSRIPSKTTAKQ